MMPLVFVIFSFLSGVFGLSYEIIYQRIFLSIAGDLFGTYVIVVGTFILGIAIGNLCGFRLRHHLATMEMLSGLFAILFALFLKNGGYLYNIPTAFMAALMLVPAFVLGTSIPLYSYYYREIKFNSIYAIYHLGSVAAILAIEFYLLFHVQQTTLLLAIGCFHILLGACLYSLYQKGLFKIQPIHKENLPELIQNLKIDCATVIIFSFASFYYQFWALKAIYYVLFPLRLVSSLAVAGSLFWIFIGTLLAARTPNKQAATKYTSLFIAHMALVVISTSYLYLKTPYIFWFGTRSGFCFMVFYFLSPCVWATTYLVETIKLRTSDNNYIDQTSGVFLFCSSVGNISGFLMAVLLASQYTKTSYFIPILLLPTACIVGAYLLKQKDKQWPLNIKRFFAEAPLLKLLLMVTVGASALTIAYAHFPSLINVGGFIKSIVFANPPKEHAGDTTENVEGQIQAAINAGMRTTSRFIGEPDIYPSAQATISLIHTLKPGLKPALSWGFAPAPDKPDAIYALDGYWSHHLLSPNEYKVGFLPRMYFNNTIPESLVVGIGSGETSSAVSMVSQHADLVDISPLVIRLLDKISNYNNNLRQRSNASFIMNDAMNYLKQTDKKYQVIVNTSTSQYTVWAAKLYSSEFLTLIKNHLTPDGVYETWFDGGIIDSRYSFFSYFNMLKRSFRYIDVHFVSLQYIQLIAYDQPRDLVDFNYAMLSPEDAAFMQHNADLMPEEQEINTSYIRNVLSDEQIPTLEPSLDFPAVENMAVQQILSPPENNGKQGAQIIYDIIQQYLHNSPPDHHTMREHTL